MKIREQHQKYEDMIYHRSYAHNLSSCEITLPFYAYITTPQSGQFPDPKPRRQWQGERHQTKGLTKKTIAVYVRYNSWYISLPFSA